MSSQTVKSICICLIFAFTWHWPALAAPPKGQAPAAASDDDDEPTARTVNAKVKSDLEQLQKAVATNETPDARNLAETVPDAPGNKETLSIFKAKKLPPLPVLDHTVNSVVHIPPIVVGQLIARASVQPLELDATHSRPITLQEALNYAAYNSLPLRISKESLKYQRLQLAGTIISALPLPTFSTSYNLTQSRTLPNTIEKSEVFPVTLRFSVFSGGSAVYGMLAQFYREQGWEAVNRATINDTLLDVYQKYNNLLLQHALLRIRAKAVAVSEAQLRLNNAQYRSGEAAALGIMQSRTQLGTDRQALQDQEVAVRQAALALAFALNLPLSINLVPADMTLQEAIIANFGQTVDSYLQTALVTRPDLRQYEMFRLAAARNVTATASSWYPSISLTTAYSQSSVTVTPPNGTVGGVAVASITAAQNGLGTASANALGQTASFSPTGSVTASSGISNTVATQVVAASGGQPLNVVQSGSLVTSGAASPSFISSGSGGGPPNINGSNAPSAGVFGGQAQNFQGVASGSWSLSSMGLNTLMSTLSAQSLQKEAMMQSNQELILVAEQIRADYCNLVAARYRIDNAAVGVVSAAESLRLSNLRLTAGMGTNLEAIQAQRDYVNALITQAQSIITSNIAQAQIAHDTGTISIDRLTTNEITQKTPGSIN